MGTIPLSAVADIAFVNGPPMISSDNAMLRGAVLFNVRDSDLGSTVQEAIEKIGHAVTGMPQGYYLEWSGQIENLNRGKKQLKTISPIVVDDIFFFLSLALKSYQNGQRSL